jgi:phytoene desaturase
MSFHPLLIGGNPFAVTCVYALITSLERRWGVHYAMGGTGTLVTGLVKLLQRTRRTELRLQQPRCGKHRGRASALANGDRDTGVTLANGEHLAADIVVSNADTAWTYRHLVDEPATAATGPTASIDRGRFLDEPVRLVLRHHPAISRNCRTT